MHQINGLVSEEPVFCVMCGKMLLNQGALIRHVSTEHKVRCGHCNATFSTEDQLVAHMVFHGEEKFSCNICNQSFSKSSDVVKHKRINHTSKYVSSEESGKCSDNVSENPSVKLFHKEEKQSELCDSGQSRLTRSETSKLTYQCDTCSKWFSRKFDLKRHRIKHHTLVESKEPPSGKENKSSLNEFSVVDRLDKNKLKNKCGHKRDTCYEVVEYVDVTIHEKHKAEKDEEVLDVADHSDDSVNSDDISRHLDIPAHTPPHIEAEITTFNQNYKCTLCNHGCTRKHDMIKHRRKAHTIEARRKDPFESSYSSKKKPQSKIFPCSQCNNSYSRGSDLQRHIHKKHGGEKYIGRSVDSIDDMDIEIINQAKQDINGTTVYHCNVCGKNMLTKRGFVRHVRVHTGERPYTCHVCGKQYRSSTDLTRHLRCVHDGIKNYQCDVCGRCFANKGTRNDHRRIHTGERPFICHTCGKAFPTPNSIYVHRRTHTDYFPHQCTSCDKRFRRRQQLIHHIRTHTGEKPHACDICGKCFGVKDEVSRHRLTHSSEKPHVCSTCGLCFGQKRYLTNHLKTHHARMM